jgi:hypothetical protein
MSDYRYVIGDPRQNRAHYFYAPFEGLDFLRHWARARVDFMATLNIEDVVPPALDFPPDLGSQAIACEPNLRACASALAKKAAPDSQLEEWAGFAQRKIEIAHRLRAQYDTNGKMACQEDADSAAYAFAAYLLAWRTVRHGDAVQRLKWLNALLKCIDILTVAAKPGLDSFAAFCAKQALLVEHNQVLREAERLGVSWE